MDTNDNIDEFNKTMADKIGSSMQQSLIEAGILQKGTGRNLIRDYIYRMLSFYSSIGYFELSSSKKTAQVRRKEIEIEFETYVTQPELWKEWKQAWDLKKPLHDHDWLKRVQKEEERQYKESEP